MIGGPPAGPRAPRSLCPRALAAAVGAFAVGAPHAGAQTDFYNTDHGRPLQVEDAVPVERHAFELQAAPLRLERARGGAYEWGIEPSLAWGVLRRTHLELGVPVAWRDRASGFGRRAGIAGLELSALHQLNTETTTLPAFGVAASVLAPVGALAPAHPYASATALATRTFAWGRVHANAEGTIGPDVPGARLSTGVPQTAAPGAVERSRWMTGLSVDHTFAVRSLLVAAETVARRPLGGEPVAWTVGAGARWQAAPRWALDGGLGRRLTGDEAGWYVTVGSAYAFGIPSMFGGR